jgi:hypothetical protein
VSHRFSLDQESDVSPRRAAEIGVAVHIVIEEAVGGLVDRVGLQLGLALVVDRLVLRIERDRPDRIFGNRELVVVITVEIAPGHVLAQAHVGLAIAFLRRGIHFLALVIAHDLRGVGSIGLCDLLVHHLVAIGAIFAAEGVGIERIAARLRIVAQHVIARHGIVFVHHRGFGIGHFAADYRVLGHVVAAGGKRQRKRGQCGRLDRNIHVFSIG